MTTFYKMNACMLNIMVHHYYSSEPWPGTLSEAARIAAYRFLSDNELIICPIDNGRMGNGAYLSAKGKAWVDALIATPFPIKVTTWEVPK